MLKGKNAIITGANRGIGFATLKLFAENGCNIWACVRNINDEFLCSVKKLEIEYGIWICPVKLDLSDSNTIKEAVKEIRSKKENIDILVNNAGIEQKGSFFQMTSMNVFRDIFNVNVFGQIEFSQYISKLMMRNKYGSIINLCSIAGIDMTSGYMAYSASKAALISVTKTMACELSEYNIKVNGVAPGIANTDMAMGLTEEARENTKNNSLMVRVADPKEISEAIMFLASDKASYITGQILRVDGGMA